MASSECPSSDGYDEERFEKEVDSKLQCPICFKVLNEPMQCSNQHYFCRFCIRRHLRENSETCPMCQHHLTEETLTKAPRIVEQFLWSLKIRCDYAERGCPELVELQFLGKHVKDCGFVPSPCPNPGCTELVNHCDKKEHVEELCRFRPVMICEECGQEVLQKFSRFHPCMMKRAMDSLAARINVLNTEMIELKSAQQEFMSEVQNMMVGVKAANEDATYDLERRMTAVIAEAKAAYQGVVEDLHRKMRVEMEAREAKAEEETMYLKKELEETKNQVASLSKQLELKDVNVKRPEFEVHVHGNDFKLKTSANPWRRPRETEQELVKEDKKTAKLYRRVLVILNKITLKNFETLVPKMMALKIDTYERLEGVVEVIFEKAINEPMYSEVYANMCRRMFPIRVVGPDRKAHTFRKPLLNRLQLEFYSGTVFEKNIPVEKDISCEDKEDQIGEVIKRETKNDTEPTSCAKQTRLKYERDFLLQFQFIPYCLTKPPDLPDVEIVLDVPSVQNTDVLRRSARSALLPCFAQKRGKMEENVKVLDGEAVVKSKKRKLGFVKFTGELCKLKLIAQSLMHDVIFKLLRAGDEVSLEGLCSLLGTIGKDLDFDRAKPRMQQYFDQINKIIAAKKISSKVRFMLCDVVDLRASNWVPRHEKNLQPQTFEQARTEARVLKQGMAQKSCEQGNPFNTAVPVNFFPLRMMPRSSPNQNTWRKEATDWIAVEEGRLVPKDWGNRASANIRYDAVPKVTRQNSDEEVWVRTKSYLRKFCDLCDAFGQHNTNECPLLEDQE